MHINDGSVALFHYTLKNAAGEVLDSSAEGEPLAYLHGGGNIVPGLESQMLGKQAGDVFTAIVSPELGYGVPNTGMIQQIPKDAFPPGQHLEVGMQFGAQTPGGSVAVTITHIDGDMVTVDGNHPLAGVTLHFDVEIVSVRAASSEETAHGHVHGAGGHHH